VYKRDYAFMMNVVEYL